MDVMLVTIVFPWPSEAFAGVEVRALRAAGATVRVRALRSSHPRADELLDDWGLHGLDLTDLSIRSVMRGLAFTLWHPYIALRTVLWLVGHGWTRPKLLARCLLLIPRMFAIFDECLVQPPQVLNLFWGHYPSVLAYMTRRWLPGVHVSMSLNAYDLVYGFPPSVDAARYSDSLWTFARANLPALTALGIDTTRVHVSVRGVDLDQVPKDCSAKDPNQLVTIARLESNKGVDDVIRAFGVIAADHPGLKLTIIGEGPDRIRLEQFVEQVNLTERVVFTGGLSHSLVYEHLCVSSVLLLLSRSPAERLPNAVKEALACRCLCIVTETPGIDDLVDHLKTPMVVSQGNWRGAADWLTAILADPDGFEVDRDSGRNFVMSQLDSMEIARQRLAIWGVRK